MAYFERVDDVVFRATEHVAGAWSTDEQHIAPPMGLLAHVVERDREARGREDLVVGRLSYDILGTLPVGPVTTDVAVVRPGRTIELVEATLSHDGRAALVLRAWLMRPGRTESVAGSALPRIAPPEETDRWDPTTVWPGGFIASVEVRRTQVEPGRASLWVRPRQPLVADEEVGPTARFAGILDIANGMTVREDPRRVAFPNLDLTAHLVAEPRGEWVGLDTTVTFGTTGLGLTSSVLHDETGPIGGVSQVLTVRPG